MSTRLVRLVQFVVGTLVLAGALVAIATWLEGAEVLPPAATPAPSSAPAASAAPSAVTPVAAATPAPTSTADAASGKPAGYDQSCAREHAWAQFVRVPFVCIDTPASGATVTNGAAFAVRGYAGGAFENNVVVEWQLTLADGRTPPGAPPRIALTYSAPDVAMPGAWNLSMNMNETGLPARLRLTAYFESPRDGARVAEASVEVTLR